MNNSEYSHLITKDRSSPEEICLDNAATTPVFKSVLKAVCSFVPQYSSVHRGSGKKSQAASEIFEECRRKVLGFVKGDSTHDVLIFTKNTTDAINKLSRQLAGSHRDTVICTDMEHHSNDLPWRNNFNVCYVRSDKFGRLCLNDFEDKLRKLSNKVRLVAVTGASNVTGYINDIHQIAEAAHKYGAEIFVDAAQLAPHAEIDIRKPETAGHIDYLAFSSHKMYAPFGAGVLISPRQTFSHGSPDHQGGGTVKLVTHDTVIWEDTPYRDEAGTPNLIGAVAMAAAVETLTSIGMKNISDYEEELTCYAMEKLNNVPNITLYNNTPEKTERISVIPFNINGIYHEELSFRLAAEAGIAVRSGCFCAQPYVQKLLGLNREEVLLHHINNTGTKRPGMVRISFGLYNKKNEIDALTDYLVQITEKKTQNLIKRNEYAAFKHF